MDKLPITLEEATIFFSEIYRGIHHIPSEIKMKYNGCYILDTGDMSTFDWNKLTRLIFLAHDKCYRVEFRTAGMKIAIFLSKRYTRKGSTMERHPTIEEALATWRETHPIEGVTSFIEDEEKN